MDTFCARAGEFVQERVPELLGDFVGPCSKWAFIVAKLLIDALILPHLPAIMTGPVLASVLLLLLLFFAIPEIYSQREPGAADKPFATGKLAFWLASLACMRAPFFVAICVTAFLASWLASEDPTSNLRDPALRWFLVFALHRTGLACALFLPPFFCSNRTAAFVAASLGSLACISGPPPFLYIGAPCFLALRALSPFAQVLLPPVLYSISLLASLAIALEALKSADKNRDDKDAALLFLWIASSICIFAPLWISVCASLLALASLMPRAKLVERSICTTWLAVFVAQQAVLLTLQGFWGVASCMLLSSICFLGLR